MIVRLTEFIKNLNKIAIFNLISILSKNNIIPIEQFFIIE